MLQFVFNILNCNNILNHWHKISSDIMWSCATYMQSCTGISLSISLVRLNNYCPLSSRYQSRDNSTHSFEVRTNKKNLYLRWRSFLTLIFPSTTLPPITTPCVCNKIRFHGGERPTVGNREPNNVCVSNSDYALFLLLKRKSPLCGVREVNAFVPMCYTLRRFTREQERRNSRKAVVIFHSIPTPGSICTLLFMRIWT